MRALPFHVVDRPGNLVYKYLVFPERPWGTPVAPELPQPVGSMTTENSIDITEDITGLIKKFEGL